MTIAPLLQEMFADGLCVQVYHKNGIFTSGKKISLHTWIKIICDNKLKINNLAYTVKEYYLSKVKKIPDLVEKLERHELQIHKIFVAGRPDTLGKYALKAADLGLSVDYYPGTRDYMYLEIAPPGISKGWAIKELAKHLQIDMEEVAAIGDNLNDTSMIQAAGLGIVMGNGHKQLKAVAGKVTLGNDEDGVAAAINSIILDSYPSQQVV
jgi:hydroxymethylpyrimidine pyrophosphatase-like HAD family hydrolase